MYPKLDISDVFLCRRAPLLPITLSSLRKSGSLISTTSMNIQYVEKKMELYSSDPESSEEEIQQMYREGESEANSRH